jgi:hypothetical protein
MDNQSTEQQPGLTVGLVIPLRNYAFDLILFVAGTFTASIPKAKPARPATNRKPVINVTGVKAGEVSAKLTLHEGDQFLIERIAGPTEQTLGGHPQMRKVIHDLGVAGCGRQDERAALPVDKVHSIVSENPVRRRYAIHPLATARRCIGVAGENAGSGDGVGPVLRPAENAAQCAHDRAVTLLSVYEVSGGQNHPPSRSS